jgi:two-component system CheB/CheR fusion protein
VSPRKSRKGVVDAPVDVADPAFEPLLDYIQEQRLFDFRGYKRTSLMRRVRKRMQEVGLESFETYRDRLEVDPEEFSPLFNTILISVTSFFRDAAAWDALCETVLPAILQGKTAGEPIRVWSAGCASGEEPYTLAMVLAEALGPEAFRERVKIYGTDVDDEALEEARHATYDTVTLESLPATLREKYFEGDGGRRTFRPELRRQVVFGRHDLVQDSPISRLDLLTCRNTLMYFNSETQGKILARFHFALNPSGYLFVGRAEMLLTRAQLFTPLDLKARIFQKVVISASGSGR